MRNALFYLTYNGVYNFTNGIGTQTQLLLAGLEQLQRQLVERFGGIDLHIVCPAPDAHTWGYDDTFFHRQQQRLHTLGGRLHLIPYKAQPEQELWSLPSWQTLCTNVVPLLRDTISRYDRSLLICVDQPWLHLPRTLGSPDWLRRHRASMLLVLYNTAFIRNWETPDAAELAWEQEGLAAAQPGSPIYLADICPSFTQHLITHFALSTAQFAPYTSSIMVREHDLALPPASESTATLRHYNIPLDKDIIFAFGRAAPIKGFELLIPALAPLRERVHFVLISVPYITDDSSQRLYDRLLTQHQISATHIKSFTRELPRALCQWPRTKMVVIPSRQETFSNITLEVALWAQHGGPVVVASAIGGFVDQIEDGVTGFLFDLASPAALTSTMQQVLQLPPERHAAMRQCADQRVRQRYDFAQNFPATVEWLWPEQQS
jgi:glycosyltransferase involved in cell wall biosynthesis